MDQFLFIYLNGCLRVSSTAQSLVVLFIRKTLASHRAVSSKRLLFAQRVEWIRRVVRFWKPMQCTMRMVLDIILLSCEEQQVSSKEQDLINWSSDFIETLSQRDHRDSDEKIRSIKHFIDWLSYWNDSIGSNWIFHFFSCMITVDPVSNSNSHPKLAGHSIRERCATPHRLIRCHGNTPRWLKRLANSNPSPSLILFLKTEFGHSTNFHSSPRFSPGWYLSPLNSIHRSSLRSHLDLPTMSHSLSCFSL